MSICHRNILNKYYQKCCKLEPLLLALCSLSLSLYYLQVTDQLGNTLKKSIAQYKNSSIIREAWDEVQKTVRKSKELLFSLIDWLCVVLRPVREYFTLHVGRLRVFRGLSGATQAVLRDLDSCRLICGTILFSHLYDKIYLTRMRNTLLLRLKKWTFDMLIFNI